MSKRDRVARMSTRGAEHATTIVHEWGPRAQPCTLTISKFCGAGVPRKMWKIRIECGDIAAIARQKEEDGYVIEAVEYDGPVVSVTIGGKSSGFTGTIMVRPKARRNGDAIAEAVQLIYSVFPGVIIYDARLK